MRRLTMALVLGLCVLCANRGAARQTSLVDDAIRAYEQFELNTAAGLIRRALAGAPETGLSQADVIRALMYLGAAELFLDRPDSSASAFRRLVLTAPEYRPDDLVFPPPVLRQFQRVRGETKVVVASVPSETELFVGRDRFDVELFASSFHPVSVGISAADGRALRRLYDGGISDSLRLQWDGRDDAGQVVPDGNLRLTVESRDAEGRVIRSVQLPIEVSRILPDTLPHPLALRAETFLPERAPAGPALRGLVSGIAMAALVAGMPYVLGGGADATDARLIVGATASLAGIAWFASHRPGRPLRSNLAHNRGLREAWNERRDYVARINRERLADVVLRLRAGSPTRIESAEAQ